MITRGQYEFLNKFQKHVMNHQKKDETCKATGKKMVHANIIHTLLSEDKGLLPNDPYLSKFEDANFEPYEEFFIPNIDDYLNKAGLVSYIKRDKDSPYYKSTCLVEKVIKEYEDFQEEGKRIKVNYILGILTFIVTLLTLIFMIIFKAF